MHFNEFFAKKSSKLIIYFSQRECYNVDTNSGDGPKRYEFVLNCTTVTCFVAKYQSHDIKTRQGIHRLCFLLSMRRRKTAALFCLPPTMAFVIYYALFSAIYSKLLKLYFYCDIIYNCRIIYKCFSTNIYWRI